MNITAKWSMESVSAREADAFTTVSPITGEESTVFLGRQPDVITVNGLDMAVIPDFSEDRHEPVASRVKIIAAAERFLRCELPENTRIFAISGRYEMHNKGVDVFLEALARADQNLAGTQTSILVLCLVMGGHTGVNQAAVSGDPNASDNGRPFISTHLRLERATGPDHQHLPPSGVEQYLRQARQGDLCTGHAGRQRRFPEHAL